ncbi:M23 family metallopeptidase [Bacillus sp. H-16]|uniref:M23 family metallopeptidase n=1 Tax=Alteribacter salitolerans TaxID=2912333 RepID=UPI0019654274|nr:M23 family metallopeptidase [Alteribacter salitolerans]MBM7095978.1 M23 family metallopeptidase [Alteribacter salitolerans]
MKPNKRLVLFLSLFIVIVIAAAVNLATNVEEGTEKQKPAEGPDERHSAENEIYLSTDQVDGTQIFKVEELIEKQGGHFSYDEIHRKLEMTIGNRSFGFIYDVPVMERDGLFFPSAKTPLLLNKEGDPCLPVGFLLELPGMEIVVEEENQVVLKMETPSVEVLSEQTDRFILEDLTVDEMIEYLSFLDFPIRDAAVSTIDSHLPGAPRPYRNGYHEGIDWYGYSTGVDITTDTPVYGMAEGIVVRVDHDYTEFESELIRNDTLSATAELGLTPEYLLDKLRGKQVWVQYENGVMNRFAHLDRTNPDLKPGDRVDKDTLIGYVGNSGTSFAVNGDGGGLHLHHDLLIYGELFWKPFTPDETKEILTGIWGN